jgi:hypothetical protein
MWVLDGDFVAIRRMASEMMLEGVHFPEVGLLLDCKGAGMFRWVPGG